MARPKSRDGLTETINVSLSVVDVARLDAARGGVPRSTWLRPVVLAAVEAAEAERAARLAARRAARAAGGARRAGTEKSTA